MTAKDAATLVAAIMVILTPTAILAYALFR